MKPDPYSPWPQAGEWGLYLGSWLRWHTRNAVALVVDYGEDEPDKEFAVSYGSWWFFTLNFRLFHFYIGYKPINLLDPKFRVPDWFDQTQPACEWSIRFGVGAAS